MQIFVLRIHVGIQFKFVKSRQIFWDQAPLTFESFDERIPNLVIRNRLRLNGNASMHIFRRINGSPVELHSQPLGIFLVEIMRQPTIIEVALTPQWSDSCGPATPTTLADADSPFAEPGLRVINKRS